MIYVFSGNTGCVYCRWRCRFSAFLWIIAPHASSLRCDQSIRFVGICRFDFRDWSSRWFFDICLIPIRKSSRSSLSKVEPTITKLLQKSCRFFKVRTAKGVVNAWTCCFGYAFFRSVSGFRWWWVLVRVSEFCCKYNKPDFLRVRSRRFHSAVWVHFTFSSWFYWCLILQFNDVFPRVSEEMIFRKYKLKRYFCAFLCNIEFLASPFCWDCLNRSVGI